MNGLQKWVVSKTGVQSLIDGMSEQITRMESDIRGYQTQLNEMELNVENANGVAQQLRQEVNEQDKTILERNKVVERLTEQCDIFEKDKKVAIEALEKKTEELRACENIVRERDSTIFTIKEEMVRLRQQLKYKLELTQADLSVEQEQNGKLSATIVEKDVLIGSLEKKNNELLREIKKLQETIDILQMREAAPEATDENGDAQPEKRGDAIPADDEEPTALANSELREKQEEEVDEAARQRRIDRNRRRNERRRELRKKEKENKEE